MFPYRAICLAVAIFPCVANAATDNAECWGDPSRSDISCTKLTAEFLLSLRGKSKAAVQKAFRADGRPTDRPDGLHFLSNYIQNDGSGSGVVNVTFNEDRAVIVEAIVDGGGANRRSEFIWNAYVVPRDGAGFDRSTVNFSRPPYCSDFPLGVPPCRTR